MLRISEVVPRNGGVTLRFEGRLIGAWVEAALGVCDEILDRNRPLRLDLVDLEFVDANGVALLKNLQSRGVVLEECSPFVMEQIKSAGLAAD